MDKSLIHTYMSLVNQYNVVQGKESIPA